MAERRRATKERVRKAPRPTQATPSAQLAGVEALEANVGEGEEGVVSRHAALLSANGAQRVRFLEHLQQRHGNGYVARLIQRAVATEPPPAPAPAKKLDPKQDPRFKGVEHKLADVSKDEK